MQIELCHVLYVQDMAPLPAGILFLRRPFAQRTFPCLAAVSRYTFCLFLIRTNKTEFLLMLNILWSCLLCKLCLIRLFIWFHLGIRVTAYFFQGACYDKYALFKLLYSIGGYEHGNQ